MALYGVGIPYGSGALYGSSTPPAWDGPWIGGGAAAVILADPGWRNQVGVPAASIAASWRVSGEGRLSFHIPANVAHRFGFDDLNGRWVRWEHPLMGLWGGVVLVKNIDIGRSVECSCASLVRHLSGRRLPRKSTPATGSPGTLFLRAINAVANNDAAIPFDDVQADEDGLALTSDWRGNDLGREVENLARQGDCEYDATLQEDNRMTLEFRRQIGRDQRGRVLLAEGYQIADGQIRESIEDMANDVLGVAADRDWDKSAGGIVLNPDSIDTYGRRQVTIRYVGVTQRAGFEPLARRDLKTLSAPAIPLSVTMPDTEPQLRDILQGDTIRLWSASANRRYDFRVRSRAVDTVGGTATLTGDATVEAA